MKIPASTEIAVIAITQYYNIVIKYFEILCMYQLQLLSLSPGEFVFSKHIVPFLFGMSFHVFP